MPNTINFSFFGTSEFSVIILDELHRAGFVPSVIVTSPDMPKGRNLVLTPSRVAVWARAHEIDILQPEKLTDIGFISELRLKNTTVSVVASFGKIIPKEILDIPPRGTLNVHPSLLPEFRGASPIQEAILQDKKRTGVTVMLLDEKMDHGPILAQKEMEIKEWLTYEELEKVLGTLGGELLIEVLPKWMEGTIQAIAQDDSKATYASIIEKENGKIDLGGDPYLNYRKFLAYSRWPRTYFMAEKGDTTIRVIITNAEYREGKFVIKKVLSEGRKEMDYNVFLQSLKTQ